MQMLTRLLIIKIEQRNFPCPIFFENYLHAFAVLHLVLHADLLRVLPRLVLASMVEFLLPTLLFAVVLLADFALFSIIVFTSVKF